MAGKSLYKRAVDPWDDDVKDSTRAKENKMFEQIDSEVTKKHSKPNKKVTPRSNHKHEYTPIIVWRKKFLSEDIGGYLYARCAICGKTEKASSLFSGSRYNDKYYGELEHFFEENDKFTPIDSKTYQKTIFLGGSKIINRLDKMIKEELIGFMNQGHNILIGDSLGADKEIQKLLAENGYQKVTVYYSGDRPQINLGNFKTKHVSSNKYLSEYDRQKLKDNQMAMDCDYGYMLLQGQTKGTIASVNKLIEENKPCLVLFHDKCGNYSRNANLKSKKDTEIIKWYYEKFN